MGLITKFKQYFDLEDDSNLEQREVQAFEKPVLRKQKVVRLQNAQSVQKVENLKQNSKMVLRELKNYDEVQGIADELRSERGVVINLQLVSRYEAIRIIDFLSGSVYALGGDIQKLGPQTFLCTPENIDVSGAISELGLQIEHR